MSGSAPTHSVAPPPERPERPAGIVAPDPGPGWRWWMAPLALIVALMITIAASVVVYALFAVFGGDVSGSGDGAANVVLTVAQDGAFIGAAVLLALYSGGRLRAADFGLQRTRFWRAVGWAALAGGVYLVFAAIWSGVVGDQKQDDLFKSLGVSHGAFEVGLLAALVCVVAPIAEEFLFRGFCFAALRPTFGVFGAAVAVGLVFGGIHVASTPPVLLVPLGVFGFVLCLLRWRTDSLYPCIALHALNNSLAYASLQGWDWQAVPLLVGSWLAIAVLVRPFNERVMELRRSAA